MDQEKKKNLFKYLTCFCVASIMVVIVMAMGGFNFDGLKTSMLLLCDSFFVVGALWVLFSGLVYASGEGAFLGIGFALKGVARVFIPTWRKEVETYKQYRERKLAKPKMKAERCVFFTGLAFIFVSLIFLIIWHQL